MLKLSDVMERDVVTVTPTMTLLEAMERLTASHVTGAPVVERERVVGVISATDLIAFAAALAQGKEKKAGTYYSDERAIAAPQDTDHGALERHTVAEAMTPWVHSLPATASVIEAADIIRSAQIHRLLVMDNDRLVGIVSASDITEAVAGQRLTSRTYVFNRDQDFDERGEQ